MAKLKPLIDAEGEVRELTASDFARMKPFSSLPKSLQTKLRGLKNARTRHVSDAQYEANKRKVGERGPQKAPTKKLVSLRLSAVVLEHYKATGPGWQSRIDETLKRAVGRTKTPSG
jgi:uncharacterized protein (DUF4415 family)